LIHDHNPLHTSTSRNALSSQIPNVNVLQQAGLVEFQDNITRPLVHGMLVSSLFSSMFGSLLPGCVYTTQSIKFVAPVFVEDRVWGRIRVDRIRSTRRGGQLWQCDTSVEKECQNGERVSAIQGVATVWVPGAD